MMFDDALDEFLLSGVLPEKLRVCPFVLRVIFGQIIADFVQVVDDLHRVLLNVRIITDFVIRNSLWHFNLLFLNSFFVGIFLFLHSGQDLFSLLEINFIHFVLSFDKSTHHIIN